jgi:hypothetical protein
MTLTPSAPAAIRQSIRNSHGDIEIRPVFLKGDNSRGE